LPLRTPENVTHVESLESPLKGTKNEAAKSTRLDGRILLVEDGPVNQRIFATMLERSGARVDIAAHGKEALVCIDDAAGENWTYDLILSDMQMPEMDGYTLARTLRERGDETPIIALTAHAMAEDRDRCISAGCDDFVVKPVTRRALVSACAYWLRGPSSSEAA
jgi:CheY-like chemotaxis protein